MRLDELLIDWGDVRRRLLLPLGYVAHFAGTAKHKLWVAYYLGRYVQAKWRVIGIADLYELAVRALVHDLSKFRLSEARGFAATIFDLKTTPYGTPAYKKLLNEIRPSIDAHYARNSHHPEHHILGYEGMRYNDRVEMVADWCAAVRRSPDGDLAKSLETNQKRFGYSDMDKLRLTQLAEIMGGLS